MGSTRSTGSLNSPDDINFNFILPKVNTDYIRQAINVTKSQKHTEHQEAQDIQNNRFCVFVGCFYFYVLFMIARIISPRNVKLPPCYGH